MSDEMIAMAIKGAVIGGGLMIIAYVFQFVVYLFSRTSKAVKEKIIPRAKGQYISEEDATIRLQEEHLYDQVAKELYDNNQNPAAWAKAIEKSEGDMDKAKSFYIKFRVQSLKDEQVINNKIRHREKQLKEEKEKEKRRRKEEEKKKKEEEERNDWFVFFITIIITISILFAIVIMTSK